MSYGPISCPAMTPSNPLEGVVPVEYHGLILKSGMTVMTHPMSYAKFLIQIGYEPVAPRDVKTFFGRPALRLPSVFQYIGYIRKRDGFCGLYRGCVPKVIGVGISSLVSDRMKKMWPVKTRSTKQSEEECESATEILDATAREAAEKIACLILSHPFHVCAVRAMAQFVGGENKYDGILNALIAIYKEEGTSGYWAGFVPRAIGELTTLGLTVAATYLINTYVIEDKTAKVWTNHIVSYFASSFCYPFQVVGNCMAIGHSGLAASYPPHMPLYRNWIDCWNHLSSQEQLKRGSSLLFRYYSGPQVIVGDRVFPTNHSWNRKILKKN